MPPSTDLAIQSHRPPPIYLEGRLPVLEASIARQLGLKDGQVIQANADIKAGQWMLRFGLGFEFSVPKEWAATQRLAAGDTLRFKAQLLSDGSILLRPVTTEAARGAPGVGPPVQTTVGDAMLPDRLQQLLSKPPLLTGLTSLLQPHAVEQLARQAGEWPAPLLQWLRARPSMAALSPEQLRAWITQSGWFNEGLLGLQRSLTGTDLKTALRSLLRVMHRVEDSQARWVEDALDDIESQQLIWATSDPQQPAHVGVLLSFKDAPPVRMQVGRESPSGEDSNPRTFWVDLHVEMPELGPIWLRTRVLDGTRLEMNMWAEQAWVVDLAQSQSGVLRQQLQEAGLELLSFRVMEGQAPKPETPRVMGKDSGHILDVRT